MFVGVGDCGVRGIFPTVGPGVTMRPLGELCSTAVEPALEVVGERVAGAGVFLGVGVGVDAGLGLLLLAGALGVCVGLGVFVVVGTGVVGGREVSTTVEGTLAATG